LNETVVMRNLDILILLYVSPIGPFVQ